MPITEVTEQGIEIDNSNIGTANIKKLYCDPNETVT
jgi:hypothetical protein